ncbi:hypothetical protein BGZ73_002072 [Actinomortierella ambigua]|nr:hypothetical protein BGZ73_002072 [Actinomortierella ambigua]
MSQEDDADLQEAIRLSLLEANNFEADDSHEPMQSAPSPRQPSQREPPPFFIDFFSDDENESDNGSDIHADVSMSSNTPDDVLLALAAANRGNGHDRAGYDYWPVEDEVVDDHQDQENVYGHEGDHDQEDEDLKRAIELSLQEVDKSTSVQESRVSTAEQRQPLHMPTRDAAVPGNVPSTAEGRASTTTLASLLGQDRAEMERQRQERLRRRMASELTDPASTIRPEKRSRRTNTPPASTRSPSPPPTPTPARAQQKAQARTPRTAAATAPAPTSVHNSELPMGTPFDYPMKYVKATFKNTHITGTIKERTQVSLEDLINKQYLQRAVLTSFTSDPKWLINYLPTEAHKKVVLVVHWHRNIGEENIIGWAQPGHFSRHEYPPNLTELHPPMQGMGSMHPKLMILWYPTFCRVVVSSANLIAEDWGMVVNTLYVQDFPLRDSRAMYPEDLGEFGCTLHNFLQLMTLPQKVLAAVRTVDFSLAKVYLIPSVNGSFLRDGQFRYGSARLCQVLRNGTVRRPWDMEYQTGSLGRLSLKFMSEFYNACQGKPIEPRSRYNQVDHMPPIKVLYPTEETVQQGVLGEYAGRNIAFSLDDWNSLTFPKKVIHTYVCRGSLKGYMMHTKLILARATKRSDMIRPETIVQKPPTSKRQQPIPTTPAVPEEPIPDNLPAWEGWFLVGSHNFTESAWGHVTKKPNGLTISMRNWELSVLCPVETAVEFVDAEGLFGAMPVPYERPVLQYSARDKPWVMDRH